MILKNLGDVELGVAARGDGHVVGVVLLRGASHLEKQVTFLYLWYNFGTSLGLLWDNFETTLGQFWDKFEKQVTLLHMNLIVSPWDPSTGT